MDYSKVKRGISDIKITDVLHEVNGDENIWITYSYKGKTFSLSHDVSTIKQGCKEADNISLGNDTTLLKIRKSDFSDC